MLSRKKEKIYKKIKIRNKESKIKYHRPPFYRV